MSIEELQEEVDKATGQLLLDLAFLVRPGTNVKEMLGVSFANYKAAIEKLAVEGHVQIEEALKRQVDALKSQVESFKSINTSLERIIETLKIREQQERMFTVMDGPDIPWSIIAPFEKQVERQHGPQRSKTATTTLERVQERGGLSVAEVLSVLEGEGDFEGYWANKPSGAMGNKTANILRLQAIVRERLAVAIDCKE